MSLKTKIRYVRDENTLDIDWTKIVIATLIIWLSVAIQYIKPSKAEERFFKNNKYVRILSVIILVYLFLSFGKENFLSRIVSTLIATVLYYILIEFDSA